MIKEWQQELSEWYIPEEENSIDQNRQFDQTPLGHVEEEIDLDKIDMDDLRLEDDSFIDEIFANLDNKKSGRSNIKESKNRNTVQRDLNTNTFLRIEVLYKEHPFLVQILNPFETYVL